MSKERDYNDLFPARFAMAFFEEVEGRWLYVKNIGQRWWVVVAALWGMFWAADEIIAKWGSPPVKGFWETYTIRFPIDWKIAAVGFLVIFVLMLIEGGFRNHCQTAYSGACGYRFRGDVNKDSGRM